MKGLSVDSKGRKTNTFKLIVASWCVITVKFLMGGMDIPGIGEQPVFDLYAYGTAALLILGSWYGRERLKDKHDEEVNRNKE